MAKIDSFMSNSKGVDLEELAYLLSSRNAIDVELSKLTGRSSRDGDIGEFIASNIFKIRLNSISNQAGHDGVFIEGELKGKTVNIKYYRNRTNYIDMNKDGLHPDYYLVMTGTVKSGPLDIVWHIKYIFVFETTELLKKVTGKIGTATSVRQENWKFAEIYPNQTSSLLKVTEEQRKVLQLFAR